MKKLISVFLSLVTASTLAFAPLVSMAQIDNTASVLAGLTQQVRVLQELVASLQARFAALGRSSMAQVGAGVIGVAESHAIPITNEPRFIINDTITTTFRLGAASPSRAYTQSFKAPIDGKLKQVRFLVLAPQNGNPTKPINVSVRTALMGPVITSEAVIPSLPVSKVFDMPTEVLVNFTNPATLQKNSTYYVEYAVAAPYDSKNYYRLLVGEKNPYKDGTLYHASGQQIAVYDMTMDIVIGSNVVPSGELKVSPVQGLDKTVVAGATGVELGRFTFDATHAEENIKVVMAQVFADVLSGDLDNFQGLQLFDGSTPLNTGSNVVNPAGTAAGTDKALVFSLDSPGLTVPKGSSKTIILKGSTMGGADGNRVKFDFSGPTNPDFWRMAYAVSGITVPLNISGVPGSIITVVKNGGWTVSFAPAMPATEQWVVAGSKNVFMNVLRFTATTEDFALTNLRLSLRPDATASDVAKISLYDGSTLITSKVPSFIQGVEDFSFPMSGVGSFKIPKDSHKEMIIKIDLPCIGSICSGRAGQPVAIDFEGSDTSKNKALGISSGTEVHASTNFDIGAPGIRYFRSLPTVERVSLPVTTLTSGNHVLYKFRVTADKAYDIALHKMVFAVLDTGTSSVKVSNISLRNITDGNKRVSAALPSIGTGSKATIITDTTDYPNPWVTIPAGQTHTFELRADTTTDGSGDSISTKLVGDIMLPPIISNLKMASASELQSNAYNSRFIWSDFSADATTTHSIYTADWMNGYLVPGLLSGLDSSTLSN